ncbi:hypothetical protein BHE90_007956 [Fusarium euwallaceae]|uniref:Uncharacterized protein n=1 Tax=Fusarium euwallaceae TaxID=1147111 RepID=A0A430LPB8_9HYPO|nr:hypothetical protein BHE90_007956 [Fusarium euwallaceae]
MQERRSVAENTDCELRANESMRTFTQWADLFYDAGDEIGRTFRVCDGILEESAEKAGFEKIVHKEYTIPIAG